MNRGKQIRLGVLVGVVAVVYWLLMQVGIWLAIGPALDGLAALISILFDPVVLPIVLILGATTWIAVWYLVDDVGVTVVEILGWCKERVGITSPVVVSGSLEHDGDRWIGHQTRDGVTTVEHRACPHCAVELEEKRVLQTELSEPNTPITASEESHARETEAWENVFEREKADTEELVGALVCPRETCTFSTAGQKHLRSGESGVKKQFRTHFSEMRGGGSDPFGRWYQRATERLDGLEPTPADLWDAYVPQANDDAVMMNQAFGQGLPGEDTSVTCPALEQHKLDATGIDRLIELAPDEFDWALTRVVQSGYLERRREITRKMNETVEQCRHELSQIERQYGSMVERALCARHDRMEPHADLETIEHTLDGANDELTSLHEDLDLDYLPAGKHRWLSTSMDSVLNAREYVRELRAFEEYQNAISTDIEEFEERFEPYEEGKQYMISPDEAFLIQQCREICRQLTDLHRELQLELLPPENTEWATTENDHFTARSDLLSQYNELFIQRERERYADLFRTEHGRLNDEQQKAIVRNDLHNLVDASAGTGKTLTLTYRFLYLYRRGVPLDDIVAITFTNDAANEMKTRIAAALDGVEPHQLNVSTCHALAKEIVEESQLDTGNERGRESTEEHDPQTIHREYAQAFIDGEDLFRDVPHEMMAVFERHHTKLRDSAYIQEHKPPTKRAESYLCDLYGTFLGKTRGFDVTPDEIRGRLTEDKIAQYHFCSAACTMLESFNEYAESIDEPVDFPGMIQSATRIRRDNPEQFSGDYQHVLFDEYQDATEPDIEFVETFLGGSTHLFAVGDDWQSIYGFRGADPNFFIEFEELFDGVEQTQLTTNYRCPPAIVAAGEELMAHSEVTQNEKDVEASNDDDSEPVLHRLSGIYENRAATETVGLIENMLSEPETDPSDVMVLSRNDTASPFMNRIRSHLDEREIPRTPTDDTDEIGDPDGVQVQSIHRSKGTEAEHVILVNATDGTHHGLPASEKENELFSPVNADTTNHYAEERRLFYVAMTRAERQLHVVTHLNCESRYLADIEKFFDQRQSDVWTVTGPLGSWEIPRGDNNKPLNAQLACNGYTVELTTWDRSFLRTLDPGERYQLSNFVPENSGWGAQIILDESVNIDPLVSE